MRYLWTVFIMCMGIWGKAQTITVTGRVMEHSSKTPVEFATVWIESVGTGAITDKDGYFRLEQIPCDESKLTVSCLGYAIQELNLRSYKDKPLTIYLKEATY